MALAIAAKTETAKSFLAFPTGRHNCLWVADSVLYWKRKPAMFRGPAVIIVEWRGMLIVRKDRLRCNCPGTRLHCTVQLICLTYIKDEQGLNNIFSNNTIMITYMASVFVFHTVCTLVGISFEISLKTHLTCYRVIRILIVFHGYVISISIFHLLPVFTRHILCILKWYHYSDLAL